MRFMGPLCAGMSPLWWSDKHNKHHALTNEIGVDEDIATDPVLFVRPPDPKNDSWHRWNPVGQYQLEHHLFPSMPRSKYPALQPILKKFADVNKVPGACAGVLVCRFTQ
eukprot:Skav201631  [mRNA]  locus=scaffold3582:122033:124889:- [translate_table: standard]